MAALMGRSRHEVTGLLMEFWEWADDNVMPADESAICPGFVRIPSASELLVDTLAGADGFASALSAVGWIVIRDGAIEFPKFGRHNGKSGKRRALDAERKRTDRDPRPDSVRNMSASDADKKRTREEKRILKAGRRAGRFSASLEDIGAVIEFGKLMELPTDRTTRLRLTAYAQRASGGRYPKALFSKMVRDLKDGEPSELKADERLAAQHRLDAWEASKNGVSHE